MLIHKLPFQKRRYKELGIDIQENINTAFNDKKNGLSIMVAGGGIIGIVFLLFMSMTNFLQRIIFKMNDLTFYHFIILAISSVVICYFFIFRNEEYLKYFNQFESWSKSKKVKYNLLSLLFIVAVLTIFILSIIT